VIFGWANDKTLLTRGSRRLLGYGRAADHMAARKLLASLPPPSPAQAAAPEFSLKQFARSTATAATSAYCSLVDS
jgi:hypothetical protein